MSESMIERVAQAICGDDNPENILDIHRYRARKALEAVRLPTLEMIIAGEWATFGKQRELAEEYTAMIDAALNPLKLRSFRLPTR